MAPKNDLRSSSTPSTKRVKAESSGSNSMNPPAAVQDTMFFEIKYPIMNPSNKAKVPRQNAEWKEQAEEHISPFKGFNAAEKELNQHYTVLPNAEWAAMRKYNNFIIQGETFKSNQVVFVKGKTEAGTQPKDFWVARILQVRAIDPQHVYALIAWMYWPDELPATAKAVDEASGTSGQRKYHGNLELIASNYLDVVDVLSFAGKVDIEYLSEGIVDGALPEPKNFYWRQTFCRATQRLSDLPAYCICKSHYNPDIHEYELICDNGTCQNMYHSECLVDDALIKKYHEEFPENDTSNGTQTKDKKKKKNGKSKQKIYSKAFKGQFILEHDEKTPPMIKITDIRSNPHTETLQRAECPKCWTLFE
ncbi:hypothetical protein SBOR_3792 [Sclerotinia borealis F-4128]|uniref:BAH domain-containing protein n=1 Tax=Sclerotinia borealis (strain F-4128) TaxID=1432307 RepID=W9CMY3_SCLBF|nr:hypothetical protein SBOR_3792 [Sclerotinia borealis F-4128]